jgi:Tol biopolymer transport system component
MAHWLTCSRAASTGVAAPRTLVWVDRQGHETAITAPSRAYMFPRLSPDGTRIAIHAADQELDGWIWDLRRTTLTRATFDPGIDAYPVWTPDGRNVIWSSERTGARNLFQQAADGTGPVERLTDSPNQENPTAVTPDGRWLAYEANDSGRFEIFVRPFPDVNSGHWQVSTIGGTRPLWARNGQELFYVSPSRDASRAILVH